MNTDALRRIWVKALLSDIPVAQTVWISVDASNIPRPEAKTSEDRGIIHVPNLPHATKPLSVGWQCSTVMLLLQLPSSWAGILDQQRIATAQTAIEVVIAQVQALVPLIEHPMVLVADRWYATADFLEACKALGIQVLIRLKRNRKLYRLARRTRTKGRPPLDGPLFQASQPDTMSGAQASLMSFDERGKRVTVSSWNQLHFQQARQIQMCVFQVRREGAKDSKRDPRELIVLGEKAGSEIWVDRNTQKLGNVLPVIQVLRKGDLHHPAGKAMREYTLEERAKRNAADSSLKPNTSGLLAHAQRKSQQTQQRVHQVIDQLLREQHMVNFNTVSKAAHVTESYLYAHQEARERIEVLRTQQGQERIERQWTERQQHQRKTDRTKDVLLAAKDRRINALEAENRQLKEELKVARGKLYELV